MLTQAQIVDYLKDHGYRLTGIRQNLIGLICTEHRPLTIKEMLELLRVKIKVNKTTIYREIETFQKEGLLDFVDFGDDLRRYELKHDMHHHHLICTKCDQVDDVVMNGDLRLLEKGISDKKGFQVNSHSLEFFGICGQCQRGVGI